jgi:hydrogenase large subunit
LQLVEMHWDPITWIVGSLGIYTKIDFANRHAAECHCASSIFRGYSVFMKGKDPRDANVITSRICAICGDNHATRAVYAQNMAFGVRSQFISGQPGGRGFLRADGPLHQPRSSRAGRKNARAAGRVACLMEGRHAHPSTLYLGGMGTVKMAPLHDNLFDFFYEALPGYEQVGRRRVLLACW